MVQASEANNLTVTYSLNSVTLPWEIEWLNNNNNKHFNNNNNNNNNKHLYRAKFHLNMFKCA